VLDTATKSVGQVFSSGDNFGKETESANRHIS